MTYREFHDEKGRLWEVWEVRPAVLERREANDRRTMPRAFRDRRADLNFRLLGGLHAGWLTFQCDAERRRLSPIPEGWTHLSDDILLILAAKANRVPRAGASSRTSAAIPKPTSGDAKPKGDSQGDGDPANPQDSDAATVPDPV